MQASVTHLQILPIAVNGSNSLYSFEFHEWSSPYLCLHHSTRGQHSYFNSKCYIGGKSVTAPHVTFFLVSTYQCLMRLDRLQRLFFRFWYDPTRNWTQPTSFCGACSTRCTTQQVHRLHSMLTCCWCIVCTLSFFKQVSHWFLVTKCFPYLLIFSGEERKTQWE